ncbi:MAG: RIC1-domain-containing protein [Benjaminiella poitrasii]|nr:MAG: RIC1-domain-containing protein [Benjaminiella poitrasii]
MNSSIWLSNEGRAYFIQNSSTSLNNQHTSSNSNGSSAVTAASFNAPSFERKLNWTGVCFHGIRQSTEKHHDDRATTVAVNSKFSLIAIGTHRGIVYIYSAQSYTTAPVLSHKLELQSWSSRSSVDGNLIESLEWTSDGYAISVGYKKHGLAVYSVYGGLLCATSEMDDVFSSDRLKDTYVRGIRSLFWGPGNHQLFVLGLLQTDDRILLYNNGGDYQENNTTIDPAAVAWTHIQYPILYITDNWPIRYTSISSDGKYIAIAGKRGFAHYNAVSNRWKLFGNQQQEQSFLIRMYSRDSNLDNTYILHTEPILNFPAYMTICGNYLLVYTSENVINIYNINMGTLLGEYINSNENMVSVNIILLVDGKLMILCPKTTTKDDKNSNNVKESSSSPLNQFDIHTIHQKAEYYWIGKRNIENMITSLWIADGKGLKVFTNILLESDFDFNTYNNNLPESEPSTPITPGFMPRSNDIGRPFSLGYHIDSGSISTSPSLTDVNDCCKWRIKDFKDFNSEAIYIPLDFYPLSILLDKGVIIGIEQSISYRDSLGFILFKMSPKMHLFVHHILRYLLQRDSEEDAVIFARAYERFVYYGHALEILLHTVLEEETGHNLGDAAILPLVIKFLDQFPHALDVIVSCARKTEVALWDHLFSVVGKPKDLFELCLDDGRLRTATSYLIILQTLQPLDIGSKDTVRLLQKAMDEDDYELCKELVRFLSSIDSECDL